MGQAADLVAAARAAPLAVIVLSLPSSIRLREPSGLVDFFFFFFGVSAAGESFFSAPIFILFFYFYDSIETILNNYFIIDVAKAGYHLIC